MTKSKGDAHEHVNVVQFLEKRIVWSWSHRFFSLFSFFRCPPFEAFGCAHERERERERAGGKEGDRQTDRHRQTDTERQELLKKGATSRKATINIKRETKDVT